MGRIFLSRSPRDGKPIPRRRGGRELSLFEIERRKMVFGGVGPGVTAITAHKLPPVPPADERLSSSARGSPGQNAASRASRSSPSPAARADAVAGSYLMSQNTSEKTNSYGKGRSLTGCLAKLDAGLNLTQNDKQGNLSELTRPHRARDFRHPWRRRCGGSRAPA